jgi:L-fucose isomerase-like protein
MKMAKLGAVVEGWMQDNGLDISAVQCWTAMEEYFGVVPCTVMSMMSNELMSERVRGGRLRRHRHARAALASGTPSALLDWNNNYGDDPDKAVCFHCSNLPKHFFEDVRMDFQEIIAGTVGKQNTFGTCVGRVKAGPMSFARFRPTTETARIRGYVGTGEFTTIRWRRSAAPAWCAFPSCRNCCATSAKNGFEHHVAANFSTSAAAVNEAASKYLGWDMYCTVTEPRHEHCCRSGFWNAERPRLDRR